ncbi:MAG: hypothetical protein QMC80_01610 [Thermoplasmatales archaeon]|nr:hypothetical protein [Thermoplasmatales archaeon]
MSENIPKEHVVLLKHSGVEKEFVTYPGLLSLAHKKGLRRIDVSVVQLPDKENSFLAVVEATAEFEHGIFADVGDASPDSVDPHLQPHILRMASTRAKARALRDALNIGVASVEELKTEGDVFVPATEKQLGYIRDLADLHYSNIQVIKDFLDEKNKNSIEELGKDEASGLISRLDKSKSKKDDAHGFAS